MQAKFENSLFIPTNPQCIFSVQAATKKVDTVNFNANSAEVVTKDGTTFPILCKSSVAEKRSGSLEM